VNASITIRERRCFMLRFVKGLFGGGNVKRAARPSGARRGSSRQLALENLEDRLSPSLALGGGIVAVNPQPLPPGGPAPALAAAFHSPFVDVNPQPLPP
jgi:hypothetical protein